MKILILPDIHGRDFWIEPCSHAEDFDKIIFLGDYHDPYPFQVSDKASRHMLRDQIVPFVLEHKDKCICLYGNHDSNYIYGENSGRYDRFHAREIKEYLEKLDMKLIHREGNFLFSHSGVLPDWLNQYNLTLDDLETLSLTNDALLSISKYRGGWNRVGSCIWGDVMEYYENDHIPNLYQIFGHTQLKDPYIAEDYACLDCRRAFVLNDGELKPYEKEV